MSTAADEFQARYEKELAAKRFADQVLHMLVDYIPTACRADAHRFMCEVAHQQGFELTDLRVRQEYLALKNLMIDNGYRHVAP